MYHALTQDWMAAYAAAKQAIALRAAQPAHLLAFDFFRYYETSALLRGGDAELARQEARQLREFVGTKQQHKRFRLVHRRVQAVLAAFEECYDVAVVLLGEAFSLAEQLGLPGERWQIQAALGQAQHFIGHPDAGALAHEHAAGVVRELSDAITDPVLRSSYLTAATDRIYRR
jgi:hypothetical protein